MQLLGRGAPLSEREHADRAVADDLSSVSSSGSDDEGGDDEGSGAEGGDERVLGAGARSSMTVGDCSISFWRAALPDNSPLLLGPAPLAHAPPAAAAAATAAAEEDSGRAGWRLLESMRAVGPWLVILFGADHFAAGVYAAGREVVSKTFHSYTVRRKQGGTQSAADAKGGRRIKSAGATLRRHNEAQLHSRIRVSP